jgi:hypothetical protein
MFSSKLDFKSNTFQCPYCGVYAKHKLYDMAKGIMSERGLDYYEGFVPELHLTICSKCDKFVLWLNDKIIYPTVSVAPWPSEDMPTNIREDFLEARNVLEVSPKSACAILRLCLHRLLDHLARSGREIDLSSIVLLRKGTPQKLTDALWAVKAIGPGAIPPAEISPKDDIRTAISLFELINLIVEATISRQREADQFYNMLPGRRTARRRQTRPKSRAEREIIPTPTLLYR